MGALPVLLLAQAASAGQALPERASRCLRTDEPAKVAHALQELRACGEETRAFRRYAYVAAVELRYGGRSVAGQSIDISRGGMLLSCDVIPAVGRSVRLCLAAPSGSIELCGVIVRLGMPNTEGGRPRVGVAFRQADPSVEARLIGLITALDAHDDLGAGAT
jgi:hypothetical protein